MVTYRKGVAATLSTIVVCGILLGANGLIAEGQQERLRLNSMALEENTVASEASLQSSAATYAVMVMFQRAVSSRAFSCSNLTEEMRGILSSSFSNLPIADSDLLVRATPSLTDKGARSDNATLPEALLGYVQGNLNLEIDSSASFHGVDLTLVRSERHFLHFPILFAKSVELCDSVPVVLSSALRSLKIEGNCTVPTVDPLLLERRLLVGAPAGLSVEISTRTSIACGPAYFEFTITQSGVPGVNGTFSWRVRGEGSVSA